MKGLWAIALLFLVSSGAYAKEAKRCESGYSNGWSEGEDNTIRLRVMIESRCRELSENDLTLLDSATVAAITEWDKTLNEAKIEQKTYLYSLTFVNDSPVEGAIAVRGSELERSGFGPLLMSGKSPVLPPCSKVVFNLYSPWEPLEVGMYFSIVYNKKEWRVANLVLGALVPVYIHSHLGDSFSIRISKDTSLSDGCK